MAQPHLNLQSHEETSKRLKKLRKAVGKTQAEMAELVGVSQTAWSLNERSEPGRRISIDSSMRLCELFGVSLDWIYRGNIANLPPKLIEKMRQR